MESKLDRLLTYGYGENHIFPFFWLRGEDENTLRRYISLIASTGIRAVCLESRPHPDFCGPRWWGDLRIIIEEAKKHSMKIWILDDKHFPTGYANGEMEDAPAELQKQYLYYSYAEVLGPMKSAQLDIGAHARYVKNPVRMNFFSPPAKEWVPRFRDDRLLGVTALPMNTAPADQIPLDLTPLVREGSLVWDVPPGRWRIIITYLTRNGEGRSGYINLVNRKSVRKLIDAVYEPHLREVGHEFGNTIAGFFSDEPELGNGLMHGTQTAIGSDFELPWSDEVEEQMTRRLGQEWTLLLPSLWDATGCRTDRARVRHTYMDIVTRAVESDFSRQIGSWCEEKGVSYIGHIIEDNNAHGRLGSSIGHFYRGMAGQHMAGIDVIRGQVVPGGEEYPNKDMFSGRDGEFYHFALGKLGSSLAALDPRKKGRTMCEIFGAYRWGEGVRMMKYMVDHFLVRGVNNFVPHAFTARDYPDHDCPPHFYAGGHNPQFRHFGALMRYLNRMCDLFSGGRRIAPAAILYHADAEWMGEYMLSQKPARILTESQIDFDIIPCDVFNDPLSYQTRLDSPLEVNGNQYEILIVPYCECLSNDTAAVFSSLLDKGFPIAFIDRLPNKIVGGSTPAGLERADVVPLSELARYLKGKVHRGMEISPPFSGLRCMHYREERDIFLFTNENMQEGFRGKVKIRMGGPAVTYDVWNNKLESIQQRDCGDSTEIELSVPPYQSRVILFGENPGFEVFRAIPPEMVKEIDISKSWKRSLVRSIDCPRFGEEEDVSLLENVGLEYPEFSGIIRYRKKVNLETCTRAELHIEDAYEGVEVIINDKSAGLQVAPPFLFDITDYVNPGENTLVIEVATTLERERYYAKDGRNDTFLKVMGAPVFEPSGIMGRVFIRIN